jgi:RNA polymerase sigma-70 factor (ECF subfamily)
MAALRSGRQEALQALHRRHAPQVFRLACRRLGASAAEEVTQDVFLRVWQKAPEFDPARGSFRSWILQIARRRIINELRERGRRPRLDGGSEAALVDLAAHDGGPEEQAWAQFRKAAVRRALAALPKEQRQALSLAFFEELSHEQVASFLAVPLGTAKGRIRLGLEKLNSPLAALVALALAALGITGYGWTRRRSALGQDERALAMLTGSRMEALRLAPPGAQDRIEQGPHATYRAERGGTLVVFTLANLPEPAAGSTYRLWRLSAGTWQALGEPRPDAQGRARLLIEAPAQAWPEALRLTRENRGPAGAAPAGALVLAWDARP